MIYYKAVSKNFHSVSAYSRWDCEYIIGEKTCKIKDSVGLFAFYSLGDLCDFYNNFDKIYMKGLGRKCRKQKTKFSDLVRLEDFYNGMDKGVPISHIKGIVLLDYFTPIEIIE